MVKTMKFQSELILQRITSKNLELFGLKLITNEFQYQNLRFDTLAFDSESKSFTIIEYKNEYSEKVINQSEGYYNLLKDNPQVYVDKYNEVFKTTLKEEDFNLENTKVLIIGPKFDGEQIKVANSPHFPFEIWKVSLKKDNTITYENVITNETKSLKVTEDDLKLTEDELLHDRPDEMIEIYNAVTKRVAEEFSDVDKRILIDAFSLRRDDRMVCKFRFYKGYFRAFFYKDSLKDPKNRLEYDEIEGNVKSYLKITTTDDIDYFIELFRQVIE